VRCAGARADLCSNASRSGVEASSPQERKKLLSFVIVGGGPTGVEVAAELYDMVTEVRSRVCFRL